MAAPNADRESQFAQLLAEYQQALASGVGSSLDTSIIDDDAQLATEWSGVKSCLDLLDRVRRQWSPLAGADTPGLSLAALETPAANQVLPPLGRFRIERELGRGGLGTVFLAYDPKLSRHVALKIPLPQALASPDLRRRFLREAEAAARLSHPHIVTVLEAGEVGAVCYIAAEFCLGPTLRQWLLEHPQGADIETAARAVLQLALAVQHAHGRGVLHRDIKPSNVLVDTNGPSDATPGLAPSALSLKLTDFGMAKLAEESGDQTRSGALIGTPAYMAPEQAQGRVDELDARTDLYALGAILYETLTGRRLHNATSDVDALRSVLFEEPTPPRAVRPAIPRDLEAIVFKCVAKRPDDRYATVQQLADDLTRFLAGEPTQARPLGAVAKLWKWSQRRPAAAALAGVLAASAVALCGVVLVYSNRLREEAVRADVAMHQAQRETAASRRLLYAADVRLAHEAYKVNNIVQAIELLERNVPQPGQEDLREFAWHYLSGICRPRTLHLTGHGHPVHAVAYSPDGRLLATGAEDGTARLWAADTGQQLHVLSDGAIEVPCLAFSPDGRWLATGHANHNIRLWDVHTGSPGQLLTGHTDHVMALTYSPDGKLLASGSRDGSIRVWSMDTGAIVATFNDFDVVRSVAFSVSGDRLYAVDEVGHVACCHTSDWKRLWRKDQKTMFLAVAPLDDRLLVAGQRRVIADWQVEGGQFKRKNEFASSHTEWIQALALAPDGETFASAGKDATIQLWDAHETKVTRVIVGHTAQIWSLAWSPDGSRLASAGDDGVRIWTSNQLAPTKHSSETAMRHAAFAADSSRVLALDEEANITVRDGYQYTLLNSLNLPRAQAFRISDDEKLIAITTKARDIEVWRRQQPLEQIFSIPIQATYDVIAWSPTGDRLATCLDGRQVVVLAADTGQVVGRGDPAVTTAIRGAAFSPDRKYLVTISSQICIWDAKSMQLCASIDKPGHRLAISADSHWLAVSAGPTIQLIDLHDGFRMSTLASAGLTDIELAFCGDTLAVGVERPALVCLWDTRTRQEMLRLPCDGTRLRGVGSTSDGRRLIAWGTGTDGRGAFWEWKLDN